MTTSQLELEVKKTPFGFMVALPPAHQSMLYYAVLRLNSDPPGEMRIISLKHGRDGIELTQLYCNRLHVPQSHTAWTVSPTPKEEREGGRGPLFVDSYKWRGETEYDALEALLQASTQPPS